MEVASAAIAGVPTTVFGTTDPYSLPEDVTVIFDRELCARKAVAIPPEPY